jgi:hypothetical protein
MVITRNELDALKRQWGQVAKKIELMVGKVASLVTDVNVSQGEVEMNQKELLEQYHKYKGLQDTLERETTEAQELDELLQEWEKIYSAVTKAGGQLGDAVTRHNLSMSLGTHGTSTPSPNRGHPRKAKLPDLKLPTFSGNVLEFSSFWDTFRSVVDKNEELEPSQKLSYLKGAIEWKSSIDCQSVSHNGRKLPNRGKRTTKAFR